MQTKEYEWNQKNMNGTERIWMEPKEHEWNKRR